MRHSWLMIVTVISIQISLNATAQYDDDVALKKLRLQDLENEQNQKDYQREQLDRLKDEQPPLQLPTSRVNSPRAFVDRSPNKHTSYPSIAQSVRPLEQKITIAKPLRPSGEDYVTGAGSNFNFGISPLANNGIDVNALEGDVDTDIVSYSHDDPPQPYNLRRPQLELLSAGGSGYALSSADVLVPPFRDVDFGHNSNEGRPLSQINNNRSPSPYRVNAGNEAATNYLANSELPATPGAGTIEYASGYLPINQLSSQRPAIQYGSPNAGFRRPSIYAQSNQLAYAPIRSEDEAPTSRVNVPYPPSFISITTRRPGMDFDGSGAPTAVRPLGRSLGYGKPFRPSAVDPVPDFFANRQPKSLLDSYIPSWIVARMIEQQRVNSYPESFSNNRYLKRSDIAQARKDDFNINVENKEHIKDSRIVKKSIPVQPDSAIEKRKMTA